MENSTDIIFIQDLYEHFTFINSTFNRILGYEKEEILNEDVRHLIHPDDASLLIKDRKPLYEEQDGNNVEFRFKAKNGKYHYFSVNASPIRKRN